MTKAELKKYRARRERILLLYEQGMKQAEIARMLKMKPQRIQQIVSGK